MADLPARPAPGTRIAIDCHVLDGKFQGSRTWLLKTLEQAIPRAPDCRWFLYSHSEESVAPFLSLGNVTWRRIPMSSSILRLGFFWPVELLRRRYDTFVFQYHGPPMLASRQTLVIHDLLFESHPELFPASMRKRLQFLVRRIAPKSPAIVTVSDWTRRELMARYQIGAERIFVAPNGVPGQDASDPAGRDGRTVLFVGRIEPRKNLDLLVRAFDRMTVPNRRLVAIGAADHGGSEVLARIQGRTELRHIQRASDEELAEFYRTAAVLAFPSSAEGFGIPVIEALSAGMPVVASDRTAIPEVAGAFAQLFDPTAPDAEVTLAQMLDRAILEPEMPDNARLRAHLGQFTWERSAGGLLAALTAATRRGTHAARPTESGVPPKVAECDP